MRSSRRAPQFCATKLDTATPSAPFISTESWSTFAAAVYPAMAPAPMAFTAPCMASCPTHITDI